MLRHPNGIDGSTEFPVTSWSVIRCARNPAAPEYQLHLRRLIESYWMPVYAVIRYAWGTTADEARDLTQEFFAERILDKGLLAAYEPARGSFRSLLRASVMNFLRQTARDAGRQRRGGDVVFLSLDDPDLNLPEQLTAQGQTPEEVFDEAWTELVIRRAVAALERKLVAEGRHLALSAFRRYEIGEARKTLSYADLAAEFGVTPSQVKHALLLARGAFREIVGQLAREYADAPEDLAAELRLLAGGGV